MITKLLVFLFFFTSVNTIEDVRPSNIVTLLNTHQLPDKYNSKIANLEKRDAQQLPTETKGQVVNFNQSQVLKPHQVQPIPQEDGKHVNSEQNNTILGQTEGGIVKLNPEAKPSVKTLNITRTNTTKELAKETPKINNNITATPIADDDKNHATSTTETENALPANSPGVVKRGLIVFGAFALLAVAYFIFYRRKNKNFESSNSHSNNDANQFRYGVLQSDDRRDNLELSRIPLTMESDEEEEDDLEIFDLEQKRKSLSYVNLQTNDEDIIFQSSKDESKNNLLLDIEDGANTLINWSGNANKSIL